MSKSFNDFYYVIENGIDELNMINEISIIPNWRNLDPRRITNVFRKLGGTGRTKIMPKSYETFEIEGWAFQDLFNKLTNMYNAKGKDKKKFYVKGLKQGIFNPKAAHPKFPNELDKDDIDIVSVFSTSNGGSVILYVLNDEDGDNVFYVGIDGKGQKFFATEAKKGGLGMLFKAWVASQKNTKNIFSQGGAVKKNKKPTMPIKIISRELYDKLTPQTQNESIEYIIERDPSNIYWDEEKENWFKLKKDGKGVYINNPIKGDVLVDPKTGKKTSKHSDKFKEALKGNESKETKKKTTKKSSGPRPIWWDENLEQWRLWHENKTNRTAIKHLQADDYEVDPDTGDETNANKKRLQRDKRDAGIIPEPSKENKETSKRGELYDKLKNELEEDPKHFDSSNIKTGWIYNLGNGNIIYVYLATDNKYKISWKGNKAQDILTKYGYINDENVKNLK